jgi:hypothetical protein
MTSAVMQSILCIEGQFSNVIFSFLFLSLIRLRKCPNAVAEQCTGSYLQFQEENLLLHCSPNQWGNNEDFSHEVFWSLLRSRKVSWNPMRSHGFSGSLMKSYEFSWSLWSLVKSFKFPEILWSPLKSLEVSGSLIKSYEVIRSLEVRRFPLVVMIFR